MAEEPVENKNSSKDPTQPEVLKTREDNPSEKKQEASVKKQEEAKKDSSSWKEKFHLSHKATFIGIGVVILILGINAAIIAFVLNSDSGSEGDALSDQVTISQDTLDKLGVNRSTVDDSGAELIVGPNARFDKRVQVGGDVTVSGQLTLNDRFLAADASLANLQAGDTTLEQLNVNGDGTLSNVNVRSDLVVAGTSRLQGPTIISGLLTTESSANVSGNLTVGGALSVNTFQTNNLVVNSNVTIGGHIITSGLAPSVSAGPAVGSNGTVSISGNDISGTVAVNAGTGAGNGVVADITFRKKYGNIPHVVITPIGDVGNFHIFRDSSGFRIGVGNSLPPGGYAFDYIVMQ